MMHIRRKLFGDKSKKKSRRSAQNGTSSSQAESQTVGGRPPGQDDKNDANLPPNSPYEMINTEQAGAASSEQNDNTEAFDASNPTGGAKPTPSSTTHTGATSPDQETKIAPFDPTRLSHQDRIVVLMGPTGAGKSTFIDYATRQGGSSIGHTLSSQTSEIRAVRYMHPTDNHPIIFVDTPGFDDTHRSDIEILSQIAGWFVKVYKEQIPLAAIVYLHRISDNRMAGSPLKNLNMFASMCGQEAMPRVVLGTTMWGEVAEATGDRRESELRSNFWADMLAGGCQMARFKDSYESAWGMIGSLASTQERDQQDHALLSHEIVDEKRRLNETRAGVKLNQELMKLIADQKEAARQLEEQVAKYDNPVLVEELQERKMEIEKKVADVAGQLQLLKIPWGRKIATWLSSKTRSSSVRLTSAVKTPVTLDGSEVPAAPAP